MIPSVAVPISFSDIIYTITGLFKKNIISKFKTKLSILTGYKYVTLFSAGRNGLKELLTELYKISGKKEVIIPAYTCPTVAYSITNAGLIPVLADIEKTSFNIDPEMISSLICNDTLAIIVVHMFGKMADIKKIAEVIHNKDIAIIEDAAQAADAYSTSSNSEIGKYGDYCLLSFGKGKTITTIEGGAILSKNAIIAERLEQKYSSYKKISILKWVKLFISLIVFSITINPNFFFWIDFLNIKIVNSNLQRFPKDYKYSSLQAALGLRMLEKLDKLNSQRIANGKELAKSISQTRKFIIQGNDNNLYLRFAMICQNTRQKEKILGEFQKSGIWPSTGNFPLISKTCSSVKKTTSNYPNASLVEENIITLPTHPFVGKKDINKIIKIIINS